MSVLVLCCAVLCSATSDRGSFSLLTAGQGTSAIWVHIRVPMYGIDQLHSFQIGFYVPSDSGNKIVKEVE